MNITANRLRMSALAASVFCACALAAAAHADESTAPKPKPFDVKNTFRNICGFCHEDYGRKEGKGPQLMNDPNSDEYLFKRIKDGKPGRMASSAPPSTTIRSVRSSCSSATSSLV